MLHETVNANLCLTVFACLVVNKLCFKLSALPLSPYKDHTDRPYQQLRSKTQSYCFPTAVPVQIVCQREVHRDFKISSFEPSTFWLLTQSGKRYLINIRLLNCFEKSNSPTVMHKMISVILEGELGRAGCVLSLCQST